MEDAYLALDIGGSKYVAGLVNRKGTILAKRKGKWNDLTAEGVLNCLIRESEAIIHEQGIQPCACGVTIPGLADPKKGLWVDASFSGIRNFPICELFEKATKIPTYCENDGNAYAYAEILFGSCKRIRDFLFMNVSNGIGGAIVTGGRLVSGHKQSAAEFGHCCVVNGGRICKCGSKGCVEMYASGPGVARNYLELGGLPNIDGTLADCKVIADRARLGESIACQVFVLEGYYLGKILATAVNLLNPQRIVIGGGVSLAFDLFSNSLCQTLKEGTYAYANPNMEVMATSLGYDAGLYSGAAIAINHFEPFLET